MTRERDWSRLGQHFAAARKAMSLSQEEAADQLHVSRTTVQAIERGRQSNGTPFTRVNATMRAYARLVGWTDDSPDRITAGGDPAAAPETERQEQPKTDLPPAIAHELSSGKTIDSTVVHLGPEEDDTRIIVVLKGAEGIGDEELDKLLQQWRRTRRHLQALPGESDAPQES
ncbi:helix-turn-helix domain-containing protein [Streptomyces sp. bgisy154]|uniref:helix-turn-helix domain-containing protein n=1 Tax=Streptomyces sp. bgisy154 TaxID=3413794 RepID=UPI003D75CEDC